MDKTIILNAGHSLKEPGACYHGVKEADEVRKIRDLLVPLLEQNFKVVVVPDDLYLKESIAWVNKVAPELHNGLAFSIHLNACGQCGATGAETYFYGGSKNSKNLAKKVIDKYCEVTGFKNRGARPDTISRWKKLGWIRDTKPWACLIECCYMDNEVDLKKLKSDYQRVAFGIYEGICDVYGVVPGSIPGIDEPKEEPTEIANIIKLAKENEREKVKKQIIDFVNKL